MILYAIGSFIIVVGAFLAASFGMTVAQNSAKGIRKASGADVVFFLTSIIVSMIGAYLWSIA